MSSPEVEKALAVIAECRANVDAIWEASERRSSSIRSPVPPTRLELRRQRAQVLIDALNAEAGPNRVLSGACQVLIWSLANSDED